MGPTSTTKTLEELEAEYAALPNKRTKEGARLRKAIAHAKEASSPTPLSLAESDVGSTTLPPAEVKPVDKSGILPDFTLTTVDGRIGEKRAIYWIGVIPGPKDPKTGEPLNDGDGMPPCHQIDGIGGGISFHEYYTPQEGSGQDGTPRRGQYFGHLVELAESQVKEIKGGLRKSVVRWRTRKGRHRYGQVIPIPDASTIARLKEDLGLNEKEVARLKTKAAQFRAQNDDEPVARYIYCVKVDGPEAKVGGTWRPSTSHPPSVETMGDIELP